MIRRMSRRRQEFLLMLLTIGIVSGLCLYNLGEFPHSKQQLEIYVRD